MFLTYDEQKVNHIAEELWQTLLDKSLTLSEVHGILSCLKKKYDTAKTLTYDTVVLSKEAAKCQTSM